MISQVLSVSEQKGSLRDVYYEERDCYNKNRKASPRVLRNLVESVYLESVRDSSLLPHNTTLQGLLGAAWLWLYPVM